MKWAWLVCLAPALAVPVVDLGRFVHGDRAEQDAVARDVDAALRDVGFLCIVNHGVSEAVIVNAWRQVKTFFDGDAETKARAPTMTDEYPYGYSALGGETLARGAGEDAAPDRKEMFATGPYDALSSVVAPRYPSGAGFEAAWHAYYVEMEALSAKLLRLFARALELDDGWFVPFSDRHASALRALNYPRASRAAGRTGVRASAHTDYGSLTILRPGGRGLEVQNRTSGAWVAAPVLRKSHFLVNLGDLMERWTNDRWRSMPHRVVYAKERPWRWGTPRRQSLAFFHNLNHDARVETIATCVAPGNEPKYAPIRAFDHLMQKHLASTRPAASVEARDAPVEAAVSDAPVESEGPDEL